MKDIDTGDYFERATKHIELALRLLEFNFHEGTEDTPRRIAKYWLEANKPPVPFNWTVFDTKDTDEIIVVKSIQYNSLCEHHMMPFFGVAHVGYLPNKKIVGLSKIPRLVRSIAKRPQTQEYLTNEIALQLDALLNPLGVAVRLDGEHTCMSCRGVEAHGAITITSKLTGVFKDIQETRQEFLNLIS